MIVDDDVVWLTPPQLAVGFNKTRLTIYRWCASGFILTLGYRLKRDPSRRYFIGIPKAEYVTMVSERVASSSPRVLSSPHGRSQSPQS